MTILLAIECSTDACSVALSYGENVRERFVVEPREHHRLLLPMLQELLTAERLTPSAVEAFAFGAGPGSFTGLRLAAGVVQGLAYAVQKPVIPVSSLAAMALSHARQYRLSGRTLLVATDARMGDVYFGAYRQEGESLSALQPDQLLSREQLAARKVDSGDIVCIGNGWPAACEAFPRASAILDLARPLYNCGQVLSACEASPVYLREEVGWQKWQRKSTVLRAST